MFCANFIILFQLFIILLPFFLIGCGSSHPSQLPHCTATMSTLQIIRNDSVCWSNAGVTPDFIPSSERNNIDTLYDVGKLQEQLNQLSASGGGKLVVPKDTFTIETTVSIPSDVALVGISREESVFAITMKETFDNSRHWMKPQGNAAAFLMERVTNASIENLTIIYWAVDFPPLDFDEYDHDWVREVFHGNDSETADLYVNSVWLEWAENCKITHCNILQAGNDPVRVRYSRHITLSHNFVDRAYNKGGGGAGYYNLIHSHFCLLYKETVKRIRHLGIHKSSSYNVVFDCDLQTDVNFHNADRGHNLIENNRIMIPVWHSWRPFGIGDRRQHGPPGPHNLLFRNKNDYKNRGPQLDKDKIYFMRDHFADGDRGETNFIETDYARYFPDGIYPF